MIQWTDIGNAFDFEGCDQERRSLDASTIDSMHKHLSELARMYFVVSSRWWQMLLSVLESTIRTFPSGSVRTYVAQTLRGRRINSRINFFYLVQRV